MLNHKVEAFGRQLANIEMNNPDLQGRTVYNVMEQIGEDLWSVFMQAQWDNGQVRKMEVNPLCCTFEAVNLCRELYELTNCKILTLEK